MVLRLKTRESRSLPVLPNSYWLFQAYHVQVFKTVLLGGFFIYNLAYYKPSAALLNSAKNIICQIAVKLIQITSEHADDVFSQVVDKKKFIQ